MKGKRNAAKIACSQLRGKIDEAGVTYQGILALGEESPDIIGQWRHWPAFTACVRRLLKEGGSINVGNRIAIEELLDPVLNPQPEPVPAPEVSAEAVAAAVQESLHAAVAEFFATHELKLVFAARNPSVELVDSPR